MHPELTGRENISLHGRILGLKREDIRRRFDEIVEFADIGEALDRPVKQFSSGMQLRLGFSLAAHLEPDVLLVDEAIAVGDAGFQYRCVERISALIKENRELHRKVDSLNRQAFAPASRSMERALRSLERRVRGSLGGHTSPSGKRPGGPTVTPRMRRRITDPELLERRRQALAKAREVRAAKRASTQQ